MKPSIKSLWAQYKDDQSVLKEIKNIPSTPRLLNRWSEYAITNNMPMVFEWVSGQLPKHESYNALRLEQACVYNRNHMVAFLLRQDPLVEFNPALIAATFRGHMEVVKTLFDHVRTRHKWIWGEDWDKKDNQDLQAARYTIAQAACRGRRLDVLQHYIPFDLNDPNSFSWISNLLAICAEKNFNEGLAHLLQWGPVDNWERVASLCIQPYALQSECMLLLLENVPSHVSQSTVVRCAGDALQRLVTLNSWDQLEHCKYTPILKSLTQCISFEEFIVRERSSQILRKNHDALEDIWKRMQRETLLEHIETPEGVCVKRKM